MSKTDTLEGVSEPDQTVRGLPAGDWTQAGSPVYRTGPVGSAGTTSLPTVGQPAANDVWAEVYPPGAAAGHPTFLKMATAGVVYYAPW